MSCPTPNKYRTYKTYWTYWTAKASRILVLSLVGLLSPPLCLPMQRQAVPQNSNAASTAIFAEVSDRVSLDFQHYNGATGHYYLPEIMGPGSALLDFDNDGDLDIFLVQGSVLEPNVKPGNTLFPWRGSSPPRAKLYRNELAAGKVGSLKFTDVTEKSGIVATGYGMGVAVGDINNDGWVDVYVCNLGSNKMFLNNRDGTFTDVTKTSMTDDPRWSTSAAFFDYDRDGWLDLFVVNYVEFSTSNAPDCYSNTSERDYCMPRAFRPAGNRLFHNKGNGLFEDATGSSGISEEFGRGLGVVTADFNGDGWPDIYVANDGDPNQLWINQKNGAFKNEALLAGVAVNRDGQAEAGMGVDAGDFDGDGDEDIFVTHLMEETNTLYANQGNGFFEDRTNETGHGLQSKRYTGFGTLWFDYDNDGWLDLLMTNGAVRILQELSRRRDPYPFSQPNQLFHNTGKGTFIDESAAAGVAFTTPAVGRGAAFGDIDNDGDIDVLISNNNGRARLFLNQIGNRNHWLGIRLTGKKSNRDMLGARIEIVAPKKSALWRRVRTDGGYLSSHDPRVLVGLGTSDHVDVVRVHWPSGAIEQWKNVPIDRYVTLHEGASPEIK
jgi:enediyne biosynthesis protein E4